MGTKRKINWEKKNIDGEKDKDSWGGREEKINGEKEKHRQGER